MMHVSRRQIDKWMLDGSLRAVRVGRDRRFPQWYLREFQQSLLASGDDKIGRFLRGDP